MRGAGAEKTGPEALKRPAGSGPQTNRRVAQALRRAALRLREQRANPFRVNAYLRAARTLETLQRDVREILASEGMEGLVALPNVGWGIAGAIREMLQTGRWSLLERLEGDADPERLFQLLPGVGPTLARRLHVELRSDSLEALEQALYEGKLDCIEGIGRRRREMIRSGLASLLGRRSLPPPAAASAEPDVATLLDVDREYRDQAARGRLPRIAPRRFNPERERWLPILHTRRDGWHFTALFSNTPLAHQLGRTRDWVVLYFYDGEHRERQHTVVTETRGPLAGRRVVRGREAECRAHYAGGERARSGDAAAPPGTGSFAAVSPGA
jgi:hypothetical protein